jgi:hypothetical protein
MTRRRSRRFDPRNPLAQDAPRWRWRTLPVWLALTGGFIAGWYVGLFGAGLDIGSAGARIAAEPWSQITLYVVLALFSFGLSRVITRVTAIWIARRRAARGREEKRILSEPATRRKRPG